MPSDLAQGASPPGQGQEELALSRQKVPGLALRVASHSSPQGRVERGGRRPVVSVEDGKLGPVTAHSSPTGSEPPSPHAHGTPLAVVPLWTRSWVHVTSLTLVQCFPWDSSAHVAMWGAPWGRGRSPPCATLRPRWDALGPGPATPALGSRGLEDAFLGLKAEKKEKGWRQAVQETATRSLVGLPPKRGHLVCRLPLGPPNGTPGGLGRLGGLGGDSWGPRRALGRSWVRESPTSAVEGWSR